ncbi:MAG TPA: inositol monophosphatase family protein [Myxococcota bacterium]|nr:inositol monophosphatase family protein [Myxococcota bacterium]
MREPIIHVAIQAARSAGNIISRAANRLDKVIVSEKMPNDFVTDVDQRAEREIIAVIHKAYPSHAILGEESGSTSGDDYQWIIDPLDGTRNFIHGFPHFAVSIGVMYREKIEYGVIYDPMRQELFTAKRGCGAQVNDRRMRVAARRELSECLLATGFAARHRPHPPNQHELTEGLQKLLPLCGDIRRAGAAALDLAYVAAGRLDGFWEFGLKRWDIAAGILLVKEAGGMIVDPMGGENYWQTGDVVAANPTILKQVLRAIKPLT